MTKVDVTVINKAFKGIPVGGSTSVSEKDARILVALKRVARAAPNYQTRMMTAEATVQAVAPSNDVAIAIEQLHEMIEKPAAAPADPEVFVTEAAERVKRPYIRRKPLDAPADGQTE